MKKIIIANWKMHPDTAEAASALAANIEKELSSRLAVDVVVAPPFPFLIPVAAALKKSLLGAQDMAGVEDTALTGGVSWPMLASLGVRYVIVGHSERRLYGGETEAMVNQKMRTALAHGRSPILCVGEREHAGADIPAAVSEQVRSALTGIKKEWLKNLIVAYEPVWAISTSTDTALADTPERMFRARLTIEKAIAESFDAAAAKKVRIIYGGSVRADTITAIICQGHMDGALVGGASLDAKEFGAIVRLASDVAAR